MFDCPASFPSFIDKKSHIAVVGLGYVGLPLAIALSRPFSVLGFDVNAKRIEELAAGRDHTGEVLSEDLVDTNISFSSNPQDLTGAAIIIVAVPTPIDKAKNPDLTPLIKASETVGKYMPDGAIIVYESTVYPGVTEEICVPILEKASGKICNDGFFVGYSPERINPGDKVHTVDNIVKVVSASTKDALELLACIYGSVIMAGVHKAPSIKVAEAAKVIENTQRDLNIALMNELSLIFDNLGIDTLDVLKAAGTKWNFLPFRPGLVGGHCIGVDPYYLTFKAEETGYLPEVILAGRRINDSMGKYVAQKAIKLLIRSYGSIGMAKVGIFGFTFKENVPDLRNSKVMDIVDELKSFGIESLIHDPLADPLEALGEYGVSLRPLNEMVDLDAIIVAVPHEAYGAMSLSEFKGFCKPDTCPPLLDIKGFWDRADAEGAGFIYWRL
ncbi:nucleotide sugar dehydrogenase [Desulfovibrio sp. OttesenSCG-928-G15]|nr:nucleotide sugar dehydrogenase [Desulfovibrio sp. OttesenSCG-928-G15]